MRLSDFKIDGEKAVNGEWISGLEGAPDFSVLISALDSPQAEAYSKKIENEILGRPGRRKIKTVPPQVRDYVYAKTLIDICVQGWRGLEDGAYSKEFLEKILLVDDDQGIRAGKHIFHTPDGKITNIDHNPFLVLLLEAAAEVGRTEEDEATEKKPQD